MTEFHSLVLVSRPSSSRPSSLKVLVEPKSWAAGDGYYLRAISGAIIVRQTAAAHRKIESLINALDVPPGLNYGGGLGGGLGDTGPT